MPRMSIKPVLSDAVRRRHLIRFRYAGRSRMIQPHALHQTARGRWLVQGFQVAGYSHSQRQPPWRTFRLDRIENLEVLPDTFMPWQHSNG